MAFVHSLVRTDARGRRGWCAPAEMGEAAPHYVSFVIPVDDNGGFFPECTCETIVSENGEKRIEPHELMPQGGDSFLVCVGRHELWFSVRPVPKAEQRLPYLGKLEHADFAHVFTEIEAENQESLDELYDEQNTFIIGCEPFAHYTGMNELAKSR